MGGQLSLYQQGPWCFYLLLHLACWAWSACSPRADSDPVPLCPQMGPKETDDTWQQTTLPIYRLRCHLYGCWHYRTHLKCLKWLLSTAGSAHRLWCSIDKRGLQNLNKINTYSNYLERNCDMSHNKNIEKWWWCDFCWRLYQRNMLQNYIWRIWVAGSCRTGHLYSTTMLHL